MDTPLHTRIWLATQQQSLRALGRLAVLTGRASRKSQHLLTGESGETAALFFLRRCGYVITARRWKAAKYPGDIDLIAWYGDILCFVEVKTRSQQDERYTAESAVTRQKRNTLRRLAREYTKHVRQRPRALRFDVVAVYGDPGGRPEFKLWQAAFSGRRED